MFTTILVINISASLFLTGLIWFVQIVQYPGFHKVKGQNFQLFHSFHISRIAIIVIPPMLIEIITSLWLVLAFDQLWLFNVTGLVFVAGIWISTFVIQVRYHRQLRFNISPEIISRLISSNWIRTLLWSAKSALGIYLLLLPIV